MAFCGGTGSVQAAHPEIQELVDHVTESVNLSRNKNYQKLTALTFKSQVVAGTNYFVKAKADNGEHVHLRIFEPLSFQGNQPQLHGILLDQSEDSPLDHFTDNAPILARN